MTLESNSNLIKSANDLVKLERNEAAAKIEKYGAMSDGLIKKISLMKSNDSIIVEISLKIQPQETALDKTKYSVNDLKAQSQRFLNRIPIIDKKLLMSNHGISTNILKNISASDSNSKDFIVAKVDKAKLNELSFDKNIVQVSEHIEPVLASYPLCAQCYDWSGRPPVWYTAACFNTLTSSAYNPASAMPSNARGQGVNTATWESGLTSGFVSCINLAHLISWEPWLPSNPPDHDTLHCFATFRCLTNTASQARFFHRNSWDFFADAAGISEAYIYNNSIQTASSSIGDNSSDKDPLSRAMRHLDMWAYKFPYTVFCNPTANIGYCITPDWQCYNAISVGNVCHQNMTHYILVDSTNHCLGGHTQTANPAPRYGWPSMNLFDCSSCVPGSRGDREMPMLVAPGISPADGIGPSVMSDPCIFHNGQKSCQYSGTSYSAPICNGIAACVISADSRMIIWPEKVRAVLLATAHNVDFNNWNCFEDGRDGAGTISGADAVAFARNHVTVTPNASAQTDGIGVSNLSNSDQSSWKYFNVLIPPTKPSGKHLRIVLTWDSSPGNDDINPVNDLSDLDLYFSSDSKPYYSISWDSNVEIVDIPGNELTSGNTYAASINIPTMRISPNALSQLIYYCIAWTWVKDHAD